MFISVTQELINRTSNVSPLWFGRHESRDRYTMTCDCDRLSVLYLIQ